jgi:hypothetical protein
MFDQTTLSDIGGATKSEAKAVRQEISILSIRS